MLNILSCAGSLGSGSIDMILPNITSAIVNVVKIIIPILLIALGMVDFSHAVITNDEGEQKKAQGRFIKRVVYSIVIFLLVALIQLIFGVIGGKTNNRADFTACIDCFINGTPKSCN